MKHLLILLCVALSACATPDPVPPSPVHGNYLITVLDANGSATATYVTKSYSSQRFPAKVTFTTVTGQTMTVTGSFRIANQSAP